MRLPQYSAYRCSGFSWLGSVPSHWAVYPLKRELEFLTSGSRGWAEHYADDGALFIRIGNLTRDSIKLDLSEIQRVAVPDGAEGERTRVRSGDLLFSITAYLGSVAVVPDGLEQAFVSQHVALARLKGGNVMPAWAAHVAASTLGKTFLETRGYGGTKVQLSLDDVAELVLPVPPLAEQASITTFLDRETAKIDTLIAEQERLLELLAEKRQAVISHAVAKGLDADAPMKDSGVAWLGEVPAHWDVKAIKWLSPVLRGASPRPIDDAKYFDDEGEFAWVRIADSSASDGILQETTQRLSALGSSLSVKIYPGQLFVSIAGTVGKPCIAGIKCCIHDGFVYFPRLPIRGEFLFRVFEDGACYAGLGKMGTQLNLNTDTIGSIRIAVPPSDEIDTILAFIHERCGEVDALRRGVQRAIALLAERRSALIAAAVTGQIDVRKAA
jgi:type I restriction enzyme S subunit